ncbi:MAG TPA: hypothetical protein VME67_17505 [Mycobacterium sp.]|nr:hypothetical protein [Mycobacterium sp.]HTX96497.1 hypothetical protein [Mycobacterium sp.]
MADRKCSIPAGRRQLLADVARTGDRLATLQVLRDRLAADLDATHDPREVAALALRLSETLKDLDQIPSPQQVSTADEISQRRARRRTRAASPASAPRSG